MVTPLLTTNTNIEIDGELVSKPYIDITIRYYAQGLVSM